MTPLPVMYLKAYRDIRHNEIFSECGNCRRKEATMQENLDYTFMSLTKCFVVPYISVCPQVLVPGKKYPEIRVVNL